MTSTNNTNSRYLVKGVRIVSSVLIVFLVTVLVYICSKANAEMKCSPCSECSNPFVELKPMRLGGDIPGHFKKYETNFAVNYWSGWGWLYFKKKNPCAEIYYLFEQEGRTSRHGVKSGNAKYIIQSNATISTEIGQTPVMHYSGWDGSKYTKKQPKLATRLGRIEIHHDLIALKNGEKYDSGAEIYDWIQEPPENDFYGNIGREKVNIGGFTYTGSDGLFFGEWQPGALAHLANAEINFEKGDVGVTIRKKETPSNCSIHVDDTSKFPPYYILLVSQIKNEFNEPLPNNVRIALKVAEGHILGGEKTDGWSIFTTKGGKITESVLYEPPSCDKAKKDKLEIAGVCDFHDGTTSLCKSRVIEKTIEMKCHDVTVNITGTANWKRDDKRYTSQMSMEIRITGTMKLKWAGKDAEHYEPDRMQLHYQHHEKVVDKEKGCIKTEVSGTGSSPISGGSFILSFRRGQLSFQFNLEPLELHVKRGCKKVPSAERRNGTVAVNIIVKEKLDRREKIFAGNRTWEIPDLKKDLHRPSPSEGFFVIPFMQNEFDASEILEKYGMKAPATMQPFPSPGPDMKLEWKFEKMKSVDQKTDSGNDKSERRKKRGSKRGSP